jgi:hypothetical protein
MLTPMRVSKIAIGCAGVLAASGLVWADAGTARDRDGDTLGFSSHKQSGQRCRLEADQTFRTAAGFRFRGRIAVEYRKAGSKTWRGLAAGTTRGRGPVLTKSERIRERVPVSVSLKPSAVKKLADDGGRFRAVAVQRLKVGDGPLERIEILQGVNLSKCTLAKPSRLVETSLTGGLLPQGSDSSKGTASVVKRPGHRRTLTVTAKLPRSAAGETARVRLFNSDTDTKSLVGRHVGSTGKLSVTKALPSGYLDFSSIDVTVAGESVLRGPLPD